MGEKIIIHTGFARFIVCTPFVAGGSLKLDFNPLIEQFSLSTPFVLLHWQARPKGYREWGVYDGNSDRYFSTLPEKIYCSSRFSFQPIQLDDRRATTLPSSVLFLGGARILVQDDGFLRIDDLSNS